MTEFKSLKAIVFSIMESISKFHITDDHDISEEWIMKKVDDVNGIILKDYMKQGLSLDGFYKSTCCITVACEEPYCTIDGQDIYSGTVRWYSDLPAVQESLGWKAIRYLGRDTFQNAFTRVTQEGFISSDGAEWTGDKPTYFTIGNRAYFKNLSTTGISRICLIAILQNPTSICDYEDATDIYPTPDPFKLEMIVKQDILAMYGITKDEQADTRDTTGNQPIQQPKQQVTNE